ncbi:GNAT family N-acetyltransferase [Mangrovibacterium lignilyticum]|uniref:GNAT family N-acetyltransferase n=1 Tax=Mangrovibacterium lignilyticum TaxID=2668052 RepID=UPI001EE4F76E|nr:GNAT family protein [Mangrovibacterium lignilyticum]
METTIVMQVLVVDGSIRLEKIKYSHAFQVFQAIDSNRKFLTPWLPFVQQTRSQEDTESFIRSILAESGEPKDEVFTVWYKSRFAGLIGLKETDYLNQKTEIGYWLIESMTGKGIMTKSVKTLIDFLFGSMNMNRIQIKCGVGNYRSSAIPKRLGFTFEGVERDGEKHQRSFIDLEVYSLLKNDYGKR